MDMKKRGEHRAGFFKCELSMLLIIVLLAGSISLGSVMAEGASEEGTEQTITEQAEPVPAADATGAGEATVNTTETGENGTDTAGSGENAPETEGNEADTAGSGGNAPDTTEAGEGTADSAGTEPPEEGSESHTVPGEADAIQTGPGPEAENPADAPAGTVSSGDAAEGNMMESVDVNTAVSLKGLTANESVSGENFELTALDKVFQFDGSSWSSAKAERTLPSGKGTLSYAIENSSNLKLVSIAEMQAHLYDSQWEAANDTVAIGLELTKDGESSPFVPIDLAQGGNEIAIGNGGGNWTFKLTLYHSMVMSMPEAKEGSFKIQYTFTESDSGAASVSGSDAGSGGGGSLPSSYEWEDTVKVTLKPSLYQVTYNLEFDDSSSTIIENNEFQDNNAASSKTITREAAYGSKLLEEADLPVAVCSSDESQSPNQCFRGTGNWILGESSTDSPANSPTIPYGGKLEVTGEGLEKLKGGKISFYTTLEKDGKLDLRLKQGDTIEIGVDGYTKGSEPFVHWAGNYNILMNDDMQSAASDVILKFSGDLSSNNREVFLGKLSIQSIELAGDAKVKLIAAIGDEPSRIEANNILVPSGAALDFSGIVKHVGGNETKSFLKLTPASGTAAIGDRSGGNGIIKLEKLEIKLELPGESSASGIGPGNQEKGGSNIELNNCVIDVQAKAGYTGTWIGGRLVENVTLSGTTLTGGIENSDQITVGDVNAPGPYALDGERVYVKDGSSLGREDYRLSLPIRGGNTLIIKKSNVY